MGQASQRGTDVGVVGPAKAAHNSTSFEDQWGNVSKQICSFLPQRTFFAYVYLA